jgi:hypothetical protein
MTEDEVRNLVEEKVKINLKTKVALVAVGFVGGVIVTAIVIGNMNNRVEEVVESIPVTTVETQAS